MLQMPCEGCILQAMCVAKDITNLFLDCTMVSGYVKYDLDDKVEIGRRVDRINEVMKRAFRFEIDVAPLVPDYPNKNSGPFDEYYVIFDDENGKDFVMHYQLERKNANSM